jgi:DNA-binding response OmpR family regulator
MNEKQKILIVDDEQDICEILQYNIENEGFETKSALSAESALPMLEKERFSLILLDIMMGKMSGFQLAKLLKDKGNDIPIIFLTAKDTENDMLTGFSIGADDFIRKPFSVKEVIARIKNVLRRAQPVSERQKSRIEINERFSIDLNRKTVEIDGKSLLFTKKEFEILTLLAQNPQRVFSREEILDKVWRDEIVLDRTVDTHIAKIRKKLGAAGDCIVNRNRYGYSFCS